MRATRLGRVVPTVLLTLAACTPAAQRFTERGIELAGAGNLTAAEASFRDAIANDPSYAMAAYQLGVLAEDRADDRLARAWYRRAASRAKDVRVDEYGRPVLLSVWALRGLDRVTRRIAAEEAPPMPAVPSTPALHE